MHQGLLYLGYEDLHIELENFIVFLRNIEIIGIINNNFKKV